MARAGTRPRLYHWQPPSPHLVALCLCFASRYEVGSTAPEAHGTCLANLLHRDVLLQPYYSYDNGLEGFRVTVYLPANCPVPRVEGPWLKSKAGARQV